MFDEIKEMKMKTLEALLSVKSNADLFESILDSCYREAEKGQLSIELEFPENISSILQDICTIFNLKGFHAKFTVNDGKALVYVSWGNDEDNN